MTDVIIHAGVKGMKWGVRKSDHSGSSRRPKASQMSDAELRNRINRLQMEQQYSRLNPSVGQKAGNALIKWASNQTMQVVNQQVNKRANKAVDIVLDRYLPATASKKKK